MPLSSRQGTPSLRLAACRYAAVVSNERTTDAEREQALKMLERAAYLWVWGDEDEAEAETEMEQAKFAVQGGRR